MTKLARIKYYTNVFFGLREVTGNGMRGVMTHS